MELAREARDEVVTAPLGAIGTGRGGETPPRAERLHGVDAETSTLMLRRCTALAARARVDLLSPSRCGAADELVALLAQMESWDPSRLEAPDPTMTVLAAAALQDLAARLRLTEPAQESSFSALLTGIDAVLAVLQRLMAGARTNVPA